MIKTKIFGSPKNRFLPKGLTHVLGQKMPHFSVLRFSQSKTSENVQ